MDVFDLPNRLVDDYGQYTHNFIMIADARISAMVDRALEAGAFSSYVPDYCTQQKIDGMNLNGHIAKQLPVPPLPYETEYPIHIKDFWSPRFGELTCTAWDLEAAFFHLYLPAEANSEGRMARNTGTGASESAPADATGLSPTPHDTRNTGTDASESASADETGLSLFPRKEEAAHGHYRTKDNILNIYDAMQHAIATGEPYQTRLDPPPADPRCCHPPKGATK